MKKDHKRIQRLKAYRAGLKDCMQERESLSATLKAAERFDLQIEYARGWVVAERLIAGETPELSENYD